MNITRSRERSTGLLYPRLLSATGSITCEISFSSHYWPMADLYGYSDKTTLSYAAIFNIKKGLHLRTEEYVSVTDLVELGSWCLCTKNWLSSLFYFGWVAWAVPTNLLMQKFPLGKYLAVNASLFGPFYAVTVDLKLWPLIDFFVCQLHSDFLFQHLILTARWGILLMAQAASRNFVAIAVLRFFSGAL